MKTPAVTMVAAWIRAETGVGPSIASGSQVWSGICADFPIAPMNSRMQARVSESTRQPRKSIVVPTTLRRLGEHLGEIERAEDHEDREDAEREAEIADPVDEEGLDRRGIGRGPVVPEADQQIGHQADAFPAEKQLHKVVGRDQRQHEKGEQAQIGHEARDRLVLRHVADGIDMDHRRDDGDDEDHHAAQGVEADRPGDVDPAGDDPAEQRNDLRLGRRKDVAEHDDAEHRRQQERAAGDELRAAVADRAAEKAGDDRGDERQKDDGERHGFSPSSC